MIVLPGELLRHCDALAVPGQPDLMHHKYVVRDGTSVWTGSTNWTNDSWSLQENVIVRLESEAVAREYAADFDQLWSTGAVQGSGRVPPAWAPLPTGGRARAHFTPGTAPELTAAIAGQIAGAARRIRVCSPVLTSAPVLRALEARVISGLPAGVRGVVDATQVAGVRLQWRGRPESAWKLDALDRVFRAIPFSGKHSTPWAEGSVHDFMHAKCVVVDDTTFVGSYNLSHAGEANAENVVEIADAGVADLFTAFIDRVAARYPPIGPGFIAGAAHQASGG